LETVQRHGQNGGLRQGQVSFGNLKWDLELMSSEWLAAEQARKRRIKIYAVVGIVLVSSTMHDGDQS
jgi:hypothetical protein